MPVLGFQHLDGQRHLGLEQRTDRIVHLDFVHHRQNSDDSHSSDLLPTHWYYGIERANTEWRKKPIEMWCLCLRDFCAQPVASRTGLVNLRGVYNNRCWAEPSGRYLYGLCVVPTTAAKCSSRRYRLSTSRRRSLGLMRICLPRGQRTDMKLSEQPVVDYWSEFEAQFHIHFVHSQTVAQFQEAILCVGASDWALHRRTIRTRLYRLRINQNNALVHVNSIELEEPPLGRALHNVIDDRRIYVHVSAAATQPTFYALDCFGLLRLFNTEMRVWTECTFDAPNSNVRPAELDWSVDRQKQLSTTGTFVVECMCTMRYDGGIGMWLDGPSNEVFKLEVDAVGQSYSCTRLFRAQTVWKVDARGALFQDLCPFDSTPIGHCAELLRRQFVM